MNPAGFAAAIADTALGDTSIRHAGTSQAHSGPCGVACQGVTMSDTLTRKPSTDLIVGPLLPAIVFAEGGVDAVLARIRAAAKAEHADDISTPQGRAAIKSLAYKVARSKTALDEAGKTLGDDWRKRVDAINADRRRIRDELDALADEVRAPLTSWENQEKARVEGHEAAILHLFGLAQFQGEPKLELIDENIHTAKSYQARDWQEFAKRGQDTATCVIVDLERIREHWAGAYAEREEAARRKAEEAARVQREREAAIAARAAEEAKRQAEEKAAREASWAAARSRAEQEAVAEKGRQEAAAAEQRRLAEVRAREEAEERARQAEITRRAEAETAERNRIVAAEKAERDRLAAVEAERARVAAEAEAERKATEAREADRKHKAKVHREARDAIVVAMSEAHRSSGDKLTDLDDAETIISAIARGAVPHCRIIY